MRKVLLLSICLLFGLPGCSTKAPQSEVSPSPEPDALTQEANKYAALLNNREFMNAAYMTLPQFVENAGGHAAYAYQLEKSLSLDDAGVVILDISFKEHDPVVAVSDYLLAVVPSEMIFVENKQERILEGFYLAWSADQGKKWSFLNGNIAYKPDAMAYFFPDYSGELTIPEKKVPYIRNTGQPETTTEYTIEDGIRLFRDGDYTGAITVLEQYADEDAPDIQYILALAYQRGFDNTEQMMKWLTLSAESGYANAQHALGEVHALGVLGTTDHQEAARWYQLAADNEFAPAREALGFAYYSGVGVKQNYNKALYWSLKAADAGMAEAQNLLGWLYYNGQGVDQNYEQAFYWFQQSAFQGLGNAQNNLGHAYFFGTGVTQDYPEAIYWWKKQQRLDFQGHKTILAWLSNKAKGSLRT